MRPSLTPAGRAAQLARAGAVIGGALYVAVAEPWMRNADRIHPEWQRREIDEEVMLHPLAPGMPVSVFDPYRLTLAIPHFVMERKMLLGIKARAESISAGEPSPAASR